MFTGLLRLMGSLRCRVLRFRASGRRTSGLSGSWGRAVEDLRDCRCEMRLEALGLIVALGL